MGVNRLGPPCPECGSLVTDIKRTSRSAEGHFWRSRECPCCNHRFQTLQHTEIVAPSGTVKWRDRTVRIDWSAFRSYFSKLITAC